MDVLVNPEHNFKFKLRLLQSPEQSLPVSLEDPGDRVLVPGPHHLFEDGLVIRPNNGVHHLQWDQTLLAKLFQAVQKTLKRKNC